MWAALGWEKLDLQCPLLAINTDGISLSPHPQPRPTEPTQSLAGTAPSCPPGRGCRGSCCGPGEDWRGGSIAAP